ncbi:hypothetical protein DYI95_004955 [Thermaerobacter sp. PB12/4term]|uniref:flagellar biosynthesis protein FlhF n=1 Tax=Thermaerobacter sp. PB12/4term TaxID=2293838 RepID=UPI000E326F55|nr:hypothetical protein [Thermaerobacter sp. PB12/4term]QIA26950.1 hypothetical protein DYI95_004955 [Thermaerobacter sp. PB12/4term]
MKIKRFRAPDMRTALEQVRAEMGRDAVILQSRSVRGRGIWAWLGRGRRWVEVTAAWDGTGPEPGAGGGEGTGTGLPGPAPVEEVTPVRLPVPPSGLRIDVAVGQGPLLPPLGGAPVPAGRQGPLEDRWPETGAGPGRVEPPRRAQAVHATEGHPRHEGPPARGARPLRFPPAARPLAGVVAVLGPTGAGKTTTVAKLAARAVLDEGRDVALLAADTYRLGATRSLAAYAELLGLPLAVAYSPGEAAAWVAGLPWEEPGGGLARATAAAPAVAASRGITGATAGDEAPELHAGGGGPAGPGARPVPPSGGSGDGPLALVDTAGRNLLLPEVAAELATLLSAVRPWRVLLVLPATLAPAEAAALVAVGRQLGATDLVLTKLDECLDPAAALSRAARWGLPLALVGCGQRVPDDLLPGTQQVLASWLGARPGQVAGTGGGSGHGFSGTGAG